MPGMRVESFERVKEVPIEADLPAWVHPGWATRFPWLLQATTHRGDDDFNLRFFGGEHRPEAERRLAELGGATGFGAQVLSHQVHETTVLSHADRSEGLSFGADADGHATEVPGLLLAVSVADCVPIFLVARDARAIALLHAGWRSAAGGILEEGLRRLSAEFGVQGPGITMHLGPAICGSCYEVGPEVFSALGEPEPDHATPIDLRDVLARRAVACGVAQNQISISAHCTRCGATPFYSHRGGDVGRQLALLGVR